MPAPSKGIAITGSDQTNGTWYYTTDGGTTWTALDQFNGTVSPSNALLLADNPSTRLYFRPSPDYNGSVPGGLTFLAWDTTRGTAGQKVNTADAGGAFTFSTTSDVIAVTVTPVPDAPVNSVPGAQGAILNTPLVFSTANGNALNVNDVDGNLSSVRVTVTNGTASVTLAPGASITAGANGTNTLTISGSQAAINATLEGLAYTPTSTGTRTLTLLATDATGLTDSDVVSITVAAASTNPPRIDLDGSSAAVSIADNLSSGGYGGSSGSANLWTTPWIEVDPEGATQSPTAGDVQVVGELIQLGDLGNNNPAGQSIQRSLDLSNQINASLSFDLGKAGLTNGDTMVLEVSTNGGSSYTTLATYNNAAAGSQTVSLAGYETANTIIRFRLSSNFSVGRYYTLDNVTITAQPTDWSNPTAFTEAITYVPGSGGVAIADTDTNVTGSRANWGGATIRIAGNYQAGADILEFTNQNGITGSWDAASGTLTLSGNTSRANYATAIESIRFNNASNTPSTLARSITVQGRDDQGFASNIARSTINVIATNDAPIGLPAVALVDGVEDTPYIVTAADLLNGFSDPDGNPLSVSGLSASNGTVVNNGNGTYTITPTANFNGPVTLTYTRDRRQWRQPAGHAVLHAAARQRPADARSRCEQFQRGGNGLCRDLHRERRRDPDRRHRCRHRRRGQREPAIRDGHADQRPGRGPDHRRCHAAGITAAVVGNVVTLTGSASPAAYQSALRAITYRSTSEAPATVARTFNIVVSDGAASSATAVSTITVVAVNDPPTTTPVTLSAIAEDSGARLITQAQLLANAADPDGPTLSATGLSIASGGGTLVDNGNGTWSYTPDPDDDTAVSFSYTVTDGIASTAGTANLDITPVNDAPEVFTASPYETQRNTPLVFSTLAGNAVSVDDIDSGTLSVTLAATNGTLTLTQTNGLSFSTGDGSGDATMVFSGSLADINAALDGLSFAPTGGYLGPAGISVTASDGLAAPVSETIAIAVTTQPPRLDLQAGSPNQSATDDFSSGGYAGASGGAIPWSGDWIENDPEGANQSPSAGDVQIDAGRIQLGDPGSNNGNLAANRASIARAIDLSEYINATLAFDLSTSGNVDNADTYVVEISRDGGATFTHPADVTATTRSGRHADSQSERLRIRQHGDPVPAGQQLRWQRVCLHRQRAREWSAHGLRHGLHRKCRAGLHRQQRDRDHRRRQQHPHRRDDHPHQCAGGRPSQRGRPPRRDLLKHLRQCRHPQRHGLAGRLPDGNPRSGLQQLKRESLHRRSPRDRRHQRRLRRVEQRGDGDDQCRGCQRCAPHRRRHRGHRREQRQRHQRLQRQRLLHRRRY